MMPCDGESGVMDDFDAAIIWQLDCLHHFATQIENDEAVEIGRS